MRIENRTRNSVVGSRVELADSWWARFRGFLGRPAPIPGEGILLFPCNAVHTWGMSFDLDVLFLDDQGKVVEVFRGLGPWKRTPRVRGARYALEVPIGVIDGSATQVGDLLMWWDPAPPPFPDLISGRRRRPSQPLVRTRGNG